MPPRKRRTRGHIEQLPSGSFRAIVYGGIDPLTGRERRVREVCKTYEAAKKALTKLQRQVDEDQHPKSDITVRQAIEQWLDVAALEDTTRERYQDLIRLYILPTFGHLQAAKLDAELLERFYARLHRCRDMCTGRPRAGHACRPLSTSTTRKVHYIIRGALERAVRWRHLGVNKAAMAVAPSPERTEPDPPSADEAARLLNAAWSDPEWGLLLWLTMLTGARRGEISALRWRHIDFEPGLLSVTRSNAQPKAGLKEKQTKTGQCRSRCTTPWHSPSTLQPPRPRGWRRSAGVQPLTVTPGTRTGPARGTRRTARRLRVANGDGSPMAQRVVPDANGSAAPALLLSWEKIAACREQCHEWRPAQPHRCDLVVVAGCPSRQRQASSSTVDDAHGHA